MPPLSYGKIIPDSFEKTNSSGLKFSGKREDFFKAIKLGNAEQALFLLRDERSPDALRDQDRNTGLIQAAYYNKLNVAKKLLTAGSSLEAVNKKGNTAWMVAAQKGNTSLLDFLLCQMKKQRRFVQLLNTVNNDGNTAIMIAAAAGQYNAVKLLLKPETDLTIRNQAGQTVFDLAQSNQYHRIYSLLKGEQESTIETPSSVAVIPGQSAQFTKPGSLDTSSGSPILDTAPALLSAAIAVKFNEQSVATSSSERMSAENDVSEAYPMSEAGTVLKLMRQGKLVTDYQGRYSLQELISQRSVNHVGLALKTEAEKSDKRKKIVTARLIIQYENSEGEVQKFWDKISKEAFNVPVSLLAVSHLKGFNAISGMNDLKRELEIDFINPFLFGKYPERFLKEDGTLPNNNPEPAYGLLLTGLPGTGKTFIAERISEELGMPAFKLSPASIGSPYVSEAAKAVQEVFAKAKAVEGGSFIIADEVESYLPDRSQFKGDQASQVSDVNQFLVELQEAAKHNVFFIATTNHPDRLDAAAIREGRIDVKKDVAPPDFLARKELFRCFLKARRRDGSLPCTEEDLGYFAARTRAYSSAAIKAIANHASRLALPNDLEAPFIEIALSKSKPSYSEQEMEPYSHID